MSNNYLREDAMSAKTVETFVVGETVLYRHEKGEFEVSVVDVTGDRVTISDAYGLELTFVPRKSDGKQVLSDVPDDEAESVTIFHAKQDAPFHH